MRKITNKRLKMAEVAGVSIIKVVTEEGLVYGVGGLWHPDQDLNQLALVIDPLELSIRIEKTDDGYTVGVVGYTMGQGEGKTLTEALFNAVWDYLKRLKILKG